MKMNKIKKAALFVFAALVLTLAFSSCEEEENKEEISYTEYETDMYEKSVKYENRYYYSILSDNEKKAYEDVKEAVEKHIEDVYIEVEDEDEISKVTKAVYYDIPEYFWFDDGFTYTKEGSTAHLVLSYDISEEDIESAKETVREYINDILTKCSIYEDDYEKIKGIYEYMILNTKYEECENDQNILSVAKEGKSVCAGYAKMFKCILDEIGYECIFVNGKTSESSSHAWNMVKLNDKYYHVDVTWGDLFYMDENDNEDNFISYAYFMTDDENIFKDHSESRDYKYPECKYNDLDYFVLNDTYVEEYNEDDLYHIAKEKIKEGSDMISFKFEKEGDFKKAYEDIENGQLLDRILKYKMVKGFKSSSECSFNKNDSMLVISIYFKE